MSKYYLIPLLLLMSGTCLSEPKPFVSYGAYTYFGDYEPTETKSFKDIPSPIRAKVESHLKARLGKRFYSSLTFNGAQVIDFKELYRKKPDFNPQWEVPAYDLQFKFSRPEIGIMSYIAQIRLRSDGSVINEINLPNFSDRPDKLKFISLSKAFNTAKSLEGYTEGVARVDLVYLRELDSLVWEFSRPYSNDGVTSVSDKLEISVHTGNVLDKYQIMGDI